MPHSVKQKNTTARRKLRQKNLLIRTASYVANKLGVSERKVIKTALYGQQGAYFYHQTCQSMGLLAWMQRTQ